MANDDSQLRSAVLDLVSGQVGNPATRGFPSSDLSGKPADSEPTWFPNDDVSCSSALYNNTTYLFVCLYVSV